MATKITPLAKGRTRDTDDAQWVAAETCGTGVDHLASDKQLGLACAYDPTVAESHGALRQRCSKMSGAALTTITASGDDQIRRRCDWCRESCVAGANMFVRQVSGVPCLTTCRPAIWAGRAFPVNVVTSITTAQGLDVIEDAQASVGWDAQASVG